MSIASDTIRLDERGPAMADIAASEDERRHIAGLLASVEREANVSQRALASELGVALGLVNTYIKRCVKKGLIKVQEAPSRRYAYYLTPHGFAEKSRLTAEYLSWSLTFFRRARMDCSTVMAESRARGWRSVGLAGGSDLAEIAILAAAEQGVSVAGLADAGMSRVNVLGVQVFATASDMVPAPDGWIVTAISGSQAIYDTLAAAHGHHAVLAPALLAVRARKDGTA
jgi:DNA-binding MarR family transcriptional regulator